MKTPQGPSLFSKQTSINTYIVQTSQHQPRSVGPSGWTAACLERLTIVVLSRKEAAWEQTDIGWKYITSVQYTVPCGLCGWKYITSVQYTVQYSTVHSTVHVAGNTLQVYSTVPSCFV